MSRGHICGPVHVTAHNYIPIGYARASQLGCAVADAQRVQQFDGRAAIELRLVVTSEFWTLTLPSCFVAMVANPRDSPCVTSASL